MQNIDIKMSWLCFVYKLLGNDIRRNRMAYKSKLCADIHSLDEAGTNRDHTIFHNYHFELLYSKKVSWFSQMKLFCTLLVTNKYILLVFFFAVF